MLYIIFGIIIYIYKSNLLNIVNDYGEKQVKILKLISLYYIFFGIVISILKIHGYLFNVIATIIVPLSIYMYMDNKK